ENLRLMLESLILSIKNQAMALGKHYYRSCKQKIDNVFRQHLHDEFLIKQPLTHQYIRERFPAFEGVTLTVQSDDPYDQCGALEPPVNSVASLRAYRGRKLAKFPQTHHHRRSIEDQTQAVVDKAKKSPYLPATVMEAGGSDEIGSQ